MILVVVPRPTGVPAAPDSAVVTVHLHCALAYHSGLHGQIHVDCPSVRMSIVT